MGEDEGGSSEASRNGMPQVKGLKELKKLPVGSEGFPGQARRTRREAHPLHPAASLPGFFSPYQPHMRPSV